jgi:hypothetical protein
VAAREVDEPTVAGLSLAHEHGRALTVSHGGSALLRYVYEPWHPQYESPRPYFHPVRTLDGDLVTAYRPHDHVWHKGIAWSLPVVGEHNFWGGGSYVHGSGYLDLDDNGAMVHRGFTSVEAGPDRVAVAQELDWITPDGTTCVSEQREFAVTVIDGAWILAFGTAMTNAGEVTLGLGSPTTKGRPDAGYGGLFWRGPREFTGGAVHSPDGDGEELMGTRQPWLAFTGQHDESGRRSTLVFADWPGNPGHPVRWFVRSTQFPGACPAPFFSAVVPLPPGQTLRLRYAVAIAAGAPGPGELAELAEAGTAAMKALSQ